jgi:hypothetical protein
VKQVEGDERDRHRSGRPRCLPAGVGQARGEGVEVRPSVRAGDELAVKNACTAVEGVDQAGEPGQRGDDLSSRPGPNPQAAVDVDDRPPAVPLDLPRPGGRSPTGAPWVLSIAGRMGSGTGRDSGAAGGRSATWIRLTTVAGGLTVRREPVGRSSGPSGSHTCLIRWRQGGHWGTPPMPKGGNT